MPLSTGLLPQPPKPCAAEDTTVCGSITRADVADLVVKALRRQGRSLNLTMPLFGCHLTNAFLSLCSDKTNGKVLSAVDSVSIAEPKFEVFQC